MRIYLLRPVDQSQLDSESTYGFVIAAKDGNRAREIAAEATEGASFWTNSFKSECVPLNTDTVFPEGVVLCAYRKG